MLLEVYRLESQKDDKCLAKNSDSLVENCHYTCHGYSL